MPAATLLVADDDADFRTVCRLVLQDKYEILEAENGREAWLILRTKKPQILVADLVMPGYDGLTLTDKVRASEELKDTIVILVTAATAGDSLPNGFWKEGTQADAFLQKPFEFPVLRETIEQQIRLREGLPENPPTGGGGFL